MKLLVGLVASVIALSGCLAAFASSSEDEAAPWTPNPCDPNPSPTISRDSPTVPAFRGDLQDVARAIARAFHDPFRGTAPSSEEPPREFSPAPTDHGEWKWKTQRGMITYTWTKNPESQSMVYETRDGWDVARESPVHAIRTLIQDLGLDPDQFQFDRAPSTFEEQTFWDVKAFQSAGEGRIGGPAIEGRFWEAATQADAYPGVHVEVRTLHAVPQNAPAITGAHARDIANQSRPCLLPELSGPLWDPSTPQLDVRNDSLVWEIQASSEALGCHPMYGIFVDATTGAIHALETIGGVCVD